jgi:hypothetical protein
MYLNTGSDPKNETKTAKERARTARAICRIRPIAFGRGKGRAKGGRGEC